MPMPGDRQDHLPQVAEPLPELTQAELMYVRTLARLVKGGVVDHFFVTHHNKKQALVTDWSRDGGGRILK